MRLNYCVFKDAVFEFNQVEFALAGVKNGGMATRLSKTTGQNNLKSGDVQKQKHVPPG